MMSNEAWMAVIGMLVSFGFPVVLVVVILYYKHRKLKLTHETIARLAEKGLPVPPELLDPPQRGDPALRGGLVLLATGMGFALFFLEVGGPWSIGIIPAMMGIALLAARAIERRRKDR